MFVANMYPVISSHMYTVRQKIKTTLSQVLQMLLFHRSYVLDVH